MTVRKYTTEIGLSSTGNFKILLQQDQLDNLKDVNFGDYTCHIYMIARRPRIMFDPESIEFEGDRMKGIINVQKGITIESHTFNVPNHTGTSDLKIECPYPHTEYIVSNSNGEKVTAGKTALLVSTFGSFDELMNLEVIYVGQSYGFQGDRNAAERLTSHSTLQEIYSKIIQYTPDQDVWLILWSFSSEAIMVFDGKQDASVSDEEDDAHTQKILREGITEQQQINFTEAALIRYFQPEYNILLKDSFPNPAHKSYSECYDLDVNAVFVSINTYDIFCRLWSPKVPLNWEHTASYLLHSRKERKILLDLLKDDYFDNYDEME